jgi:hypothetical protein
MPAVARDFTTDGGRESPPDVDDGVPMQGKLALLALRTKKYDAIGFFPVLSESLDFELESKPELARQNPG